MVVEKGYKRTLSFVIKHVIFAVCAFSLALLTFVITMDKIVMPIYQGSGKEIHAPDLRNKTVSEAENIAKNNNFSLIIEDSEYHDSYPKDTISFQSPGPNTIIKPGRRIRINVSTGAKPIMVPNVVGKSLRDARLDIQRQGLFVQEEGWTSSNDYPVGIVAKQEPEGDQEVPENTGVILYISNGKKETNIIMPSLISLSLQAARDTLKAYNFNLQRVRVQREEHPDLLPDTIIEQYPDPGDPANTNDEIALIVSSSQ